MKQLTLLIIFLIFSTSLSLIIFEQETNSKTINSTFECPYSFCKSELLSDYQEYQEKTSLPLKQVVLYVNIGLNYPFYENTKESKEKNTITMLVNKYNYLPKNYIPNNLITVTKYSKKELQINSEAYSAFLKMREDIEKETMQIRIVSAYRSYDYQNNLYHNYLKYDTQEIVDTYSSRPGYSEHQTGLAIDIDNEKVDYNRFHITQEFKWMQENAYKYGFILRFPLGKEKITGYKYESWHYRYVGTDIAKYIHDNNLTYEEYYYEFLDIR